jgi:hypothetical protein
VFHEQRRSQQFFTFNPYTEQDEYTDNYDVISQGSTQNFRSELTYSLTYPPFDFRIIRDRARCTGAGS